MRKLELGNDQCLITYAYGRIRRRTGADLWEVRHSLNVKERQYTGHTWASFNV